MARAGICLGGALALSGCFLTEDKPDLKLDIPDSYVTARKGPDAALPPLDWWRGFHSKELTLLMEESLTANFDIAAAVARIQQADAAARIANAALLPTIDLNGSGTPADRADRPPKRREAWRGRGGSPVSSLYNVNLTASYTLDFWGKNRDALLVADENAIAMRYARDVVALTTLVSVANAYFNVIDSQDRVRIAHENLAAASKILDLIKQRDVAGTASQLEVSQQESLVATVRASIPPLEITLRQSKMALALLVGRAPEHFNVAGGSAFRLAIPRVAPGLPSELINQRPDIRQAEANLRSANYSVEEARASFFRRHLIATSRPASVLALSSVRTRRLVRTMVARRGQPVFHGGALLGLEEQAGTARAAARLLRKSIPTSKTRRRTETLIGLQQQALHERYQQGWCGHRK